MVMDTLQIRLSPGLVKIIDSLVAEGIYANRSDAIRDAVRRFVWEKEAGTVPYKEAGVKLIREARKRLSKEKINLEKINNL